MEPYSAAQGVAATVSVLRPNSTSCRASASAICACSVGADGAEGQPNHIEPVLQTAPGQYNDTILDGLDWLMAELERRDMKATLYLNNAWEWSGGYGTYLDWVAGEYPTPNPAVDGYGAYMAAAAKFVHSDSARALAARHVANMVSRTNRYTGRPYAESPALMSWQIANEPRAFAADSATKAAFAGWIAEQAATIKEYRQKPYGIDR